MKSFLFVVLVVIVAFFFFIVVGRLDVINVINGHKSPLLPFVVIINGSSLNYCFVVSMIIVAIIIAIDDTVAVSIIYGYFWSLLSSHRRRRHHCHRHHHQTLLMPPFYPCYQTSSPMSMLPSFFSPYSAFPSPPS